MNDELRALLAAARLDGEAPPECRDFDVLLLQNYGVIPPVVRQRGNYVWNRGFNLLLLGRGDVPRYFCKYRSTADQNLERETTVLRALNRDPSVRGLVPRTSGARGQDVQLQLSEYIPGRAYDCTLPRLREREWVESMKQILTLSRLLSTRAGVLLPHLLRGSGPLSLRAEGADTLRELAATGLAGEEIEVLGNALAGAGAVPRLLQHGDLWPANVLRHRKSWRFLDFEVFGTVRVPLYDVYHFVRNAWLLRRHPPHPSLVWVARMASGGLHAEPCRRVISGEVRALGLTPPAVAGLLVFYLVDAAAQFIRRGVSGIVWEPLMDEVHAAVELLRAGVALDAVMLGNA